MGNAVEAVKGAAAGGISNGFLGFAGEYYSTTIGGGVFDHVTNKFLHVLRNSTSSLG